MKGLEAVLENGLFHMCLGRLLKREGAVEWEAEGPLTEGLTPDFSETRASVENPAAMLRIF